MENRERIGIVTNALSMISIIFLSTDTKFPQYAVYKLHCELFKRRKLSERVKKSRKIGTQLGIEPRTF